MIRRTLGEVKGDLARIAGSVGMKVTDPRVLDYLNLATEELMNEGDWPSVIDRYNFNVYGGTITLPGPYERILYCKLNDTPLPMQSPWFEFVGYGPNLIRDINDDANQLGWINGLDGVLDRDNVATFKDIPRPSLGTLYTLRIETVVDERIDGELPDNIIVQGLDEDSNVIRTGTGGVYIEGVSFQWQTGSSGTQFAVSDQVFSAVTEAIKPVTKMPVNVYMTPEGEEDYTAIAQWGPNETVPSYRRYKIKGLSETKQYCVTSRVRRRYASVSQENDLLIISNLPALRAMMLALWYFESGDLERYAMNKQVAIDILQKEAKAYIGQQRRKPLITFNEGTGVRRDGYYII